MDNSAMELVSTLDIPRYMYNHWMEELKHREERLDEKIQKHSNGSKECIDLMKSGKRRIIPGFVLSTLLAAAGMWEHAHPASGDRHTQPASDADQPAHADAAPALSVGDPDIHFP